MTNDEQKQVVKVCGKDYQLEDIPVYIRNRDREEFGMAMRRQRDVVQAFVDVLSDDEYAEEAEKDKWNLYEATRGI